MDVVHSFSEGVIEVARLLHEAHEAAAPPGTSPTADPLVTRIQLGLLDGFWISRKGTPWGVVVWNPLPGLGYEVVRWYASPVVDPREGWQTLLSEALARGPVRLFPGDLPGVSSSEEAELLEGAGFGRYCRYELRLSSEAILPSVDERSHPIRPLRQGDGGSLLRIFEAAYRGSLDRYLFQTLEDPREDAAQQIETICSGRYGPLDPSASVVWEESGELAGAVLVVRDDAGALIIEVMVDPRWQGKGIGRRLLGASLRSLREEGAFPIRLNVTGGNRSAIRLYRSLGFVRTLGPQRGWYSRTRIPVLPLGEEGEMEP